MAESLVFIEAWHVKRVDVDVICSVVYCAAHHDVSFTCQEVAIGLLRRVSCLSALRETESRTRRAFLTNINALQSRPHEIAAPRILLSMAMTAAQYEESEYDSHG
jgi:hypothetical protein